MSSQTFFLTWLYNTTIMFYYEISPNRIFRTDSDILTYSSTEQLKPGTLVNIPLGKHQCPGMVIRQVEQPSFATKQVLNLINPTPLPPHLFKSLLWFSQYYASPLPNVLQTALPSGINKKRRQKINFNHVNSLTASSSSPTDIPLNSDQRKAIRHINQSSSHTVLLHGITGSGKTNIYLSMAQQSLDQNQSAIILVPEIALTSQLVQRFKEYFSEVILIHSELSESERHQTWLHLLNSSEPQIVIGPRSALFAPVKKLGLIIIDEAHEPSYYQEQNPKYSALRLASVMAHNSSSTTKTILGTATPTVADYFLCHKKSSVVELKRLATEKQPNSSIQIIDLKNRSLFTKHHLFSNPLIESITQSLQDHKQSLIFHNRRGSAPLTICQDCGWQANCPNCFLPLTLHNDKFALFCHSCGYKQKVPTSCPECHNTQIIHKGFGTKQIEDEMNKLFPNAKIIRLDADTETEKQIKNTYSELHSGKYDIIIGTQMIAKGFDFPHLRTLGVIQADSSLSLPDFSATERTFILLNQVIGRANRGHQAGEIFIQTYQPEHFAITTATTSDYATFFRTALEDRRRAQLPPFTFILKIAITYKTEATTLKHIKNLYQSIRQTYPKLELSQPTPAFHERTNRGYTWQLIIKAKSRPQLIQLIKNLPKSSALHFSIDPPSLL